MEHWKGGILMNDNRIRHVVDESLSHMEFTHNHRQKVLLKTKGETVVKSKISTALVLALVLILAAGVALAIVTLRETGRQILETEQSEGYYPDWPLEKKKSLVRALVDLGYAEESPEMSKLFADKLPQDEAVRVTDEVVMAFTGLEVSEVSFMGIMEAAWGVFVSWTFEEKAWYSQLMVDMHIHQEDHDRYLVPEGPIDEAKATDLATRAAAKALNMEESAMGRFPTRTAFLIPAFLAVEGGKQPYWCVDISRGDTPLAETQFENLWIYIHPETGELLEPVDKLLEEWKAYLAHENDPLVKEIEAFWQEHGGSLPWMSLESQALWSATIRPKILAQASSFHGFSLASALFIYGVPDADALSQEEAQAIAERALVEKLGRKEAEIKFYTYNVNMFYDITNPAKPLWKFYFRMPNQYAKNGGEVLAYYGADGERRPNYKVELDARSGDIVRAFGVEEGDWKTPEDMAQAM